MRYFEDLESAIKEIRRDLYKSPKVNSSRVQNLELEMEAVEALNYSYTLAAGAIPDLASELVSLGKSYFAFWMKHWEDMFKWLEGQRVERLDNEMFMLLNSLSDQFHPALSQVTEGEEESYYYGERMMGLMDTVVGTLVEQPTSRRAFWPIYTPHDAFRMKRNTRIPCSIGYQFTIRPVAGMGDMLHLTYIQRSADFERFWLSDVWLAYSLQLAVLEKLTTYRAQENLRLGQFSHIILSFHSFFEEDEEVY